MVILHIAQLDSFRASGVNVVVPGHVKHQRRLADAALWNIREHFEIEGLEQNFSAKSLDELPPPYSRPDLAVFHELYIPEYLGIAKRLRKLGIPYIIVPHSSLNRAAQKKSRLKKLPANLLLFRPFCEKAAGIQCLSETELNECAFGSNPFIAPNGIERQPVTKTSFHSDRLSFVYIGRLQPYVKGLDIMIEAFASQKEYLLSNNCRLDIYGPDDDRGARFADEIKMMISSAGAEELIALHPAVFGEEKTGILLDSDIFIQTSRSDGMPMSVLAALSFGLPCLLTEGTTFAGKAEQYGAGFNGGSSAKSVATAIRKAVENRRKLMDYSSSALRLSEEYNWDSAAQTAINKYKECLSPISK